jgi:hypothetical protein
MLVALALTLNLAPVPGPAAYAGFFVSENLGTVSAHVLEFNGSTGAFVSFFVPGGSSPLQSASGLAFGPNGNLFVSDILGGVMEYDGSTGTFIREFVRQDQGLLFNPTGLAFGPSLPAVPEPSSLALLSIGTAGLLGYRWRGRNYS